MYFEVEGANVSRGLRQPLPKTPPPPPDLIHYFLGETQGPWRSKHAEGIRQTDRGDAVIISGEIERLRSFVQTARRGLDNEGIRCVLHCTWLWFWSHLGFGMWLQNFTSCRRLLSALLSRAGRESASLRPFFVGRLDHARGVVQLKSDTVFSGHAVKKWARAGPRRTSHTQNTKRHVSCKHRDEVRADVQRLLNETEHRY